MFKKASLAISITMLFGCTSDSSFVELNMPNRVMSDNDITVVDGRHDKLVLFRDYTEPKLKIIAEKTKPPIEDVLQAYLEDLLKKKHLTDPLSVDIRYIHIESKARTDALQCSFDSVVKYQDRKYDFFTYTQTQKNSAANLAASSKKILDLCFMKHAKGIADSTSTKQLLKRLTKTAI